MDRDCCSGSAMWAFDLEKRQHEFESGHLVPTKVYESKTATLAQIQRESGMPEELVHGVGGFPGEKGPIKIKDDGREVGRPRDDVKVSPPALPPRK